MSDFDAVGTTYLFRLSIPRAEPEPVAIEETRFGRPAVRLAAPPRGVWDRVAPWVQEEFNRRLRDTGKPRGRFEEGENLLASYLGKELVLLFWALEGAASPETVIANWRGLAPEERWWLFTTAHATRDHPGYGPERGWRKAIRVAFAENPA